MLHGAPLSEFHVKERKDDLLTALLMDGAPGPFVRSQVIGTSEIRQTAAYEEVHKPLGILDIIAAPVSTASDLYVFAWLRDTFYYEKDRQLAALLRDQIRIAMRNHYVLRQAEEVGHFCAAPERLVWAVDVKPDGTLLQWPDALQKHLQELLGEANPAKLTADWGLCEWLRGRIRQYPWMDDRESRRVLHMACGRPVVTVHFSGDSQERYRVFFAVINISGPPDHYGMTDREKDVLRWVCQGKRNEEIAVILGISPFTVRNHVEKVLAKLGVENRGSAAAMAHHWFQ
ncbi:MAG: LuxR family transcriptional regulator [Spartobacteria bacterium]|nr:LuxR family transcriptional regulator [Spartobacteria bacterium]